MSACAWGAIQHLVIMKLIKWNLLPFKNIVEVVLKGTKSTGCMFILLIKTVVLFNNNTWMVEFTLNWG